MWKISTIFTLGIINFFIVYSGFPSDWKRYFFILSCLTIAALAYFVRREFQILHHTVISGKNVVTDMYVENVMKKTAPTPITIEENKIEETK